MDNTKKIPNDKKKKVKIVKKLVVLYSYDGNTRFIGNVIAESINADVLELKPVTEMSSKGFLKYVWGGKKVVLKEKPPLHPFDKNPLEYDVLFIGTPVWAFTFAPPLRTFFSNVVLENKKIALFCCHEGSMRKTLDNMVSKLKGNNIIGKNDFFHPLQSNKQKTTSKAANWAVDIVKSVF